MERSLLTVSQTGSIKVLGRLELMKGEEVEEVTGIEARGGDGERAGRTVAGEA
jgi:hypothetical protein